MAKKITPMQGKFEAAMLAGKTLSTAQVAKIGFANVPDAAYKSRQKGLNVQRSVVTTRKGSFSVYSLEM
jgi:hypothetical protein